MNRRELFLGVAAAVVVSALPVPAFAAPVPATPQGRPFFVLTRGGLYVGRHPGAWEHPPEVQHALAEGSVIFGEVSIPAWEMRDFTNLVEQRTQLANGWTRVTRQAGGLTMSMYVKNGAQEAAQLEYASAYRVAHGSLIETARTNYALNSGPFPRELISSS